jgi:hypothetical protein
MILGVICFSEVEPPAQDVNPANATQELIDNKFFITLLFF